VLRRHWLLSSQGRRQGDAQSKNDERSSHSPSIP
jgi:hypothetical protein